MIEVIMVIVILGIVSSIGSTIIANIYEHYLLQRATHRASLKTELAAQQIANYLSYRIPGTTIARNPVLLTDNLLVTDSTNMSDEIHTLLEWIGADNDGFSSSMLPGWNGFADINASTNLAIKTPGSDLTLANTILSNLSKDSTGTSRVTLSGSNNPAIFFRDLRYAQNTAAGTLTNYNPLTCMGLTGTGTTCISTVGSSTPETLTFGTPGGAADKVLVEHYKLASSAYSICPFDRGDNHYDLRLFYNYQPWNGTDLDVTNCTSNTIEYATIIQNVTVFKFAESGNTFRFKLCAQEKIGDDFNITVCKEKAIIL
jgi:hypothetical protein